jgi:hypothetical protein
MVRYPQFGIRLAIVIAVAAAFTFSPAAAPVPNQGQEFSRELLARARVFSEIGPGVAAIKSDSSGRYYVLAEPATTVSIFQGDGQRIGQIPGANSHGAKIAYAQDIDVDAKGRLYVADRGADSVKIFEPDGSLDATFAVAAPMSVVALPGGDFAVAGLRSAKLVSIFNAQGKLSRSFGEISVESTTSSRNPALGPGRIYGDTTGNIYCVFNVLPTLLVRRYDRFGYASYEASVPAADFDPHADGKPRTSIIIEQGARPALMRPAIRALAVDPISNDVWAVIGNELVHFDKDGNRRAAYRTSTKDGARIEAAAILVERNRILIADDPLGIFDFPLPERSSPTTAQR